MIRLATTNDIKEIFEIEKRRFSTDTLSQWEYELNENEFAYILVLEENNQFVGYIDYWILFEQATINKICIKESFERCGYGYILLKEALKRIDEALCVSTTLEVRVSNLSAVNLYKKANFQLVLRKPQYYDDGEDCFYMMRRIGE